jgi:esterase
MTFVVNHQVIPTEVAPARRLFLLHGIYGSLRNWKSFALDLAAANRSLEIVLVDLRNHGASQGAPAPHTLSACADDLAALAAKLGGDPAIVCGHSFGGKVAIVYAERHGRNLEQLIVLDSPPGRGRPEEPTETEAGKVLAVMRDMPMPVASRAEVARQIASRGVAPGVAQWMATNLRPHASGGYVWHFDLAALEAMLIDYWSVDGWPLLEAPPSGLRVDIVRAERSDRFTPDDVDHLRALGAAGKLGYYVLPDAAHWLHVDNPRGLLALLTALLSGPSTSRAATAGRV